MTDFIDLPQCKKLAYSYAKANMTKVSPSWKRYEAAGEQTVSTNKMQNINKHIAVKHHHFTILC